MDLKQQVQNYHALLQHAESKRVASNDEKYHREALQRLIDGERVQYQDTLRIVEAEAARRPREFHRHSRQSTGYIRNESGGFFTS